MKCEFCGTSSLRGIKVKNHKDRVIPITFCCYECYLAFWEDVKRFIPLKAYKPIEKHKRNLRKKQHKYRSYDKNAYCF